MPLGYTFAGVGAAIVMRVADVCVPCKRTWVRLHEEGGNLHDMLVHHNLEAYLDANVTAAESAIDPNRSRSREEIWPPKARKVLDSE